MTFSILLPSISSHPHEHSRCFDEVADCLQQAFQALGLRVPIVRKAAEIQGTALVLAPQLLHLLHEPLPRQLILYNFEQLYESCRWFNDFYKYHELLTRYPVWDYSDQNIATLESIGLCKPIKCELGYMPTLTRIKRSDEQDVDFLLFGSAGDRRSAILNALTAKGHKVKHLTRLYGKERDEWIARSKIHLNIHFYDAHIFETVRVSYLMANKQFVISETGKDTALEHPYSEGLVFAPYDEIVAQCEHYLQMHAERERIAQQGFDIISARSQVPFLQAALDAHEAQQRITIQSAVPKDTSNEPRIFIAIPSYKDPECISTILRIFEASQHPDRVFVGVCWQTDEKLGAFPSEELGAFAPQVRVVAFDVGESRGANWARDKAYGLYAGEEFTLLIDAHMLFCEHWDSYLVSEFVLLKDDKAVLTYYCPPYTPGKEFTPPANQKRRICVNRFGAENDPQLLHLNRHIIDDRDFRRFISYPSPFVAHHFIFSKGDLFKRIPLDPHIYFWGDEITLSARLWTHGYNIYQLPHLPAFHQWFERDEEGARDYRELTHPESERSNQRVRGLLEWQGSEAVALDAVYALGKQRSMKDFWRFAGIEPATKFVSSSAACGEWNMEARNQVANVRLPTIFVSIASYRDVECQHTIRDLFAKALYPGRVYVGVCWQVDKDDDKHCFELEYKRGNQVREVFFDWREAEGVCWARAKTHALMQQEDYILQIDSHSRFDRGWDEQFVQMYQRLNDPKAVFSTAPAKYTPPHQLEKNTLPAVLRVTPFNKNGSIRFGSSKITRPPPEPLPGLLIAAGCVFAPRAMMSEVPYDPEVYFDQEELAYALRLYTHGWNVYSPSKQLVYHYYATINQQDKQTHWNDLMRNGKTKHFAKFSQRSAHRLAFLTGVRAAIDTRDISHLKVYGLGGVRTLKQFEQESGIDFKRKTVSERGLRAEFIPHIERYVPGKIYAPELDANPKKTGKAGDANIQNRLVSKQKNVSLTPASTDKAKIMPDKYADAPILLCLHSSDARMLGATLKSIFLRAAKPEKLTVSVAWVSAVPLAMPQEMRPFAAQIIVRQSKVAPEYYAFVDALAHWKQQPIVATVREGVEVISGWDAALRHALSHAGDQAMLSQMCLPSADASATSNACMAALPRVFADELTVVPCAVEKAISQQPDALIATPLVSFDFLAADAALWFKILPDSRLSGPLADMVYASRLWTHGVQAYEPPQQLITRSATLHAGFVPQPIGKESERISLVRARHMLGIAFSENESAMVDLDKFGHGEQRDVDSFWRTLAVDISAQRMHPLSASGDWQALQQLPKAERQSDAVAFAELVKQPVNASNAQHSKLRIFVQIPSYRDEECQFTVQDLFEKAAYPDRVSVGICWQTIPEEDQGCFRVVTRPEQVRSVHFNAADSKGANWARVQAARLMQDEDFVLMIDAHTRFVQGWDSLLIDMFHQCPTNKSVLSTYPTSYTPGGIVQDKHIIRMSYKAFQKSATPDVPIVKYRSHRLDKKQWPDKPFPACTISSNFIFAPRALFQEVPLDPYIYFFGDDLNLMVRAWTHGWDVFSPHRPVLFHLWDRNLRRQHWQDFKDYKQLTVKTDKRVAHLTGMKVQNENIPALAELDKFGLGQVRTLAEFESFFGVHFAERMLETRATVGEFAYQHSGGKAQVSPPPVAQTQSEPTKAVSLSVNAVEPYINPKVPLVISKAAKLALPLEQQFRNHGAIKTYESKEVIVYDDFLPEEIYQRLYQFAVDTDYKHINTTGNVARVWNIDNGFPLRSSWNHYYEVMNQQKHPKDSTYPVKKPSDRFIEHVNAMVPNVQHLIGTPGVNWAHYSVTSWLYPPNTGLSLHNDGSGVYTGAYVYFLNQEWRLHWGGLLMVLDGAANEAIEKHKKEFNAGKFHRSKWLHESEHNDYAMEAGFARTIFPKRNRIVFIAPDAYHIVTKVLPTAGDNVRMTLAGFFNRGVLNKKPEMANAKTQEYGE